MTGASDRDRAAGVLSTPYWLDDLPACAIGETAVPATADVAVIGAGFTGLSAAFTLARAGRSVVVLDRGEAGSGASTRNTGVLGRSLKHGFGELVAERGLARAVEVYREARAAFDHVVALARVVGIDCKLEQSGRFMGARSPRQYDALARELELKRRHLGDPFFMVPPERQHDEVASDWFKGGAVIPDQFMIHPGLFHRGLLEAATAAGAMTCERAAVIAITREGQRFMVATARGRVSVRDVVVATNGYTDAAMPDLRRRVVPIRGYVIATEELSPGTVERLVPGGRCFHDLRLRLDYGRPSPDRRRLLFGGMTGETVRSADAIARRLKRRMVAVFPDLARVRVSHAWTGLCAGTFDLYPHVGALDGARYALGYCFGSGLPLGTWLGHKAALGVLGAPAAATAFDGLVLRTRPYYRGRPWFMPLVLGLYAYRDWRAR